MEISPASTDGDQTDAKIKLRSYQQEMLEASLSRNVIVAMDTGSGKTPVATFRILAELERTDSSKLAWFVAPKVALADQQHAVLTQHLPGYLIKTLLGRDNVDKWTDQRLWDATLANVRVVVSTPAVLADALTHGFVHISRLSLLIFDEAHNCIGNSPMNRIMREFYHPAKARLDTVPHILGLTASPVISTKSTKLDKLESSLDAVAITPKKHRTDLEMYVHPPEVTSITYAPPAEVQPHQVPCYSALTHAVKTYDFSVDPYVLELLELVDAGDEKALKRLEKVQLKRSTWCFEQLSAMRRKAEEILKQLGVSAAEWYVLECRRQYLAGEGADVLVLPDITQKERVHLATLFRAMVLPAWDGVDANGFNFSTFSPKVQALVDTLIQHHEPGSSNRAVVFAEQRAVVLALAILLQLNPRRPGRYFFGTFIGTSTSEKRDTAMADLVDLKAQTGDLKSFRDGGRVNAIVATSVLEEGIDVSACNLVICFDLPKNLVQYVQRRGRARQRDSKYIMLVSEDDTTLGTERFARLEQEMKALYRSERGEPRVYVEDDDGEGSEYRVKSTGALLHFDNAKAHLYHFCAVSTPANKFVDTRPEFATDGGSDGRWSATAMLPSFVHTSFRIAESAERWSKEETAIKDAAFEAYVALHKGGLVNDNLLPHTQDGSQPGQLHVDQPSIVSVSERLSSWRRLCELAASPDVKWNAYDVRLLREDGTESVSLTICLPISAAMSMSIDLYWNEHTRYTANIEQRTDIGPISDGVDALRSITDRLLRSVFASRMKSTSTQLPFLLLNEELARKISGAHASSKATELRACNISAESGLVRINGEAGRAYFLSGLERSDDKSGEHLAILTAFPKRRDFLHPVHGTEQNAAYTAKSTAPLSQCTVDPLSARYALLTTFMPSILHRIDTALLAGNLQNRVLPNVSITDQSLLIEAISSPAAQEVSDYNRLEFLGDAVLKFCASLQVMAKHPIWPEGYLSMEKTRIVSNSTLAKAARAAGLDRYIITKPFTGAKWKPPYVDEMLAAEPSTRDMSSKVLADVVEALIGAAYVDGALEKAHACIRTLLPDEDWIAIPDCIPLVVAESVQQRHVELGLVEQLVGHTFMQPELLIEALTHASFPYTSGGSSYERLEFFGDAVLDLIIVPKLFGHHRKPRHWDLHRMRDALVNGDFLAYCCMQHFVDEDRFNVVSDQQQLNLEQSKRIVHMHDFLRSGSQVTRAKRECLAEANSSLEAIKHSLGHDTQYPWPELIAFDPPKFFSDLIESTLGALFLDTGGDLSICEAFVEKLGVFEEMRRILDEHVETAFPKEQLGILADKESVAYVSSSHKGDDGVVLFDCAVKVGAENVADVGGCRSKEEAELRAARKGTAVLQARLEANSNRKKRKLDVAMRDEDAAMGATEGGGELR